MAAACGAADDAANSELTAPTAGVAQKSDTPSTSSITTTDTPVPGSTDGTFVVSEGSEATLTVNEKLSRLPLPNDAVLRTGEITGEIDLSAETASLVIELHSLESDDTKRDRYVRNRLFPNQSTATITITDFPAIPSQFADGEAFTSTVIGTVNVNGTDAEIEFSIESAFIQIGSSCS